MARHNPEPGIDLGAVGWGIGAPPQGQRARGTPASSFHRPLAAYVNALAACGLVLNGMREELRAIFYQPSRQQAEQQAAAFKEKYWLDYPSALSCMERDWEACHDSLS